MTWRALPPRDIGGVRIIVVCAQHVAGRRFGAFISVVAHITPVAIVLRDGERVRVVDPAGQPLALETVAARCPDLRAALGGDGPE